MDTTKMAGSDLNVKTCGSVFVETKNTVFYNRKLSEDQIILICKLLIEKNEIRAIERITDNDINLFYSTGSSKKINPEGFIFATLLSPSSLINPKSGRKQRINIKVGRIF